VEPERPPSSALNFRASWRFIMSGGPVAELVGIEGGVVSRVFNLKSSGVGETTLLTNVTTKTDSLQPQSEMAVHLFDNWFDPIEAACAIVFANSSMPVIEAARHSAVAADAERRSGGGGRCHRSPPRPSVAVADGKPSAGWAPSPIFWRTLAIVSSPLRVCRSANGETREQRTRSNVCARAAPRRSCSRVCAAVCARLFPR